jgi:hypothetical protein
MQGALHDTVQEIRRELGGGISDARLEPASILDVMPLRTGCSHPAPN